MMHRFYLLHRLTMLLIVFGLSAACSLPVGRSPETRYYVLSLPSVPGSASQESRTITGPRVSVGPVTIPAYLDHHRIFIRNAGTQVTLPEYDRWGEPLGDGVTRLLVESLSTRLAPAGGMALPLRSGNVGNWRISVDINRFDGAPGQDVTLDAGWTLSTPEGDAVREGHFVSSSRAQPDTDGLVRAHGALLDELGTLLANVVLHARTTKTTR